MYENGIKRVLDVFCATIALILLFPLFFGITVFLYFANNGNPFFIQPRPGKNERIFKIIKFKTMNDKRDKHGALLPDDKRLTAVGKIVRSLSLDEIPQLINVIKGDMSIIGPRPLLPEYLPLYNEFQKKRHLVKPGITGWAQVNGRNAISWDQKFDFDIWYVDHQSFFLDIKILLLTIKKVLRSEGITAQGHVTMPTFVEYIKEKNLSNL